MWGIFRHVGTFLLLFSPYGGFFSIGGGASFVLMGFWVAPPAKMFAGAHVLDATFFMQFLVHVGFIFVPYFSDANCKAQVISFVNNFPLMIHTLHL